MHDSQIANRRLNRPIEVLKEGQEVKPLGVDDPVKARPGMKMLDHETDDEVTKKKEESAEA